ncbi:hypothetical protein FOA43_000731 [Brettanomyces nanus]|uniref:Uncharacterized protein n=1 Tax=Eeniella nana TaxID=13502 RepID=A0A875RW76_EENNA|nr:uncharacterized protein FOA43_000731 [Brettanomyces nanus]QPG73421.1 hypothetical protein FOA43_000731 [Brettanomyces nanus]
MLNWLIQVWILTLIPVALAALSVQHHQLKEIDPDYAMKKSDMMLYDYLNKDQDTIEDWIPVQASVGLNDSMTYDFKVNYSSPGLSPSYEIMVFISSSLCKLPDGWSSDSRNNGISLYYTFNSTVTNISAMNRLKFSNGYVQGIASAEKSSDHDNLYITVKPDECTDCSSNYTWVYELGISQSDLVFQYDTGSLTTVIDSDYNSAVFSAANLTFQDDSNYRVYLYDIDRYEELQQLNQSWCAFVESTGSVKTINLNESTIESDNNFFSVEDLENSSDYTGVLVQSYDTISYGGAVYRMFNFSTMSSEACKVVYGLDFCKDVSYAVPVSKNFSMNLQNSEQLGQVYDDYAKSLYQKFGYAMQQIPCDADLDSRFSPIRTCNDCEQSYKQWLCSVTIPRCSSESHTGYREYNASDGRSSFVKDTIDPPLEYYEILPCIELCKAIVRDCPADFGFSCPMEEDFPGKSYGLPGDGSYVSCNDISSSDTGTSTSGATSLSMDRKIFTFWAVISILFYIPF